MRAISHFAVHAQDDGNLLNINLQLQRCIPEEKPFYRVHAKNLHSLLYSP